MLAQKKKAAEAWAPGMVTTDVGGINEKSLISCFFRAKILSNGWWGKDNADTKYK